MTAPPVPAVGPLLREWRQRRRLSQLDLALDADVSTRHLSFIETGRARPSRELVLHLADHLEVPLRERNTLLLAAGYAPMYRETPLDAAELDPVRQALDHILAGHEPYPAVVVDSRWDLVGANSSALEVLADGVAPSLMTPPVNTLRVSLHPQGLAPRIVNLEQYAAHLLDRLHRQALASGDRALSELERELRSYPGAAELREAAADAASRLFVPLVLRGVDGPPLTFFSTIATFGSAHDITIAELAIESFFPADETTATALHARRASRSEQHP